MLTILLIVAEMVLLLLLAFVAYQMYRSVKISMREADQDPVIRAARQAHSLLEEIGGFVENPTSEYYDQTIIMIAQLPEVLDRYIEALRQREADQLPSNSSQNVATK